MGSQRNEERLQSRRSGVSVSHQLTQMETLVPREHLAFFRFPDTQSVICFEAGELGIHVKATPLTTWPSKRKRIA